MYCPNCQSKISVSSPQCPNCGTDLYYCIKCRDMRLSRRCGVCGGVAVPVNDHASMMLIRPSQRFAGRVMPQPSTPLASRLVMRDAADVGLDLKDGAVIGRLQGDYTRHFSAMGYVSGKHARLDYDRARSVWTITDLSSTNGTRINGQTITPDIPHDFGIGDVITIAFTDYYVR